MQFSTAKKTLIKITMVIGEHTIIKMKLRKIIILTLSIITPIISFAQKAYETANYKGKVNGMVVKLSLADGYLAASKITLIAKHEKAKIFTPESGDADTKNQLKFLNYINPLKPVKAYFTLSNVEDNFSTTPTRILGKYNDGKREYPIILKIE
jgi:hypothetical protein